MCESQATRLAMSVSTMRHQAQLEGCARSGSTEGNSFACRGKDAHLDVWCIPSRERAELAGGALGIIAPAERAGKGERAPTDRHRDAWLGARGVEVTGPERGTPSRYRQQRNTE